MAPILDGTYFGGKINWFKPPKKKKINKELKRELMI
jgi:hypothetical protein